MALIACPDCGKEASDQAPACPHCGRPIAGQRLMAESSLLENVGCKWPLFVIIGLLVFVILWAALTR